MLPQDTPKVKSIPRTSIPPDLLDFFEPALCSSCYVCHLVAVFRELRRVLRDDGTVWLNLGDCYGAGGGAQVLQTKNASHGLEGMRGAQTIAAKQLAGIPWRVAFALQADGWWLRSDIIWAKGLSFCPPWSGSVMPESIRDRPTKSHEYLFMLTKSARYFSDFDAIREPLAESSIQRINQPTFDEQHGGEKDYGAAGVNPNRSARRALENFAKYKRLPAGWNSAHEQSNLIGRYDNAEAPIAREFRDKTKDTPYAGGRRQAPEPGEPNAFPPLGRNVRTVWTINPAPFAEAHFATFPPALVTPCILAGTSERGACATCGAPWRRDKQGESAYNIKHGESVLHQMPRAETVGGVSSSGSSEERAQAELSSMRQCPGSQEMDGENRGTAPGDEAQPGTEPEENSGTQAPLSGRAGPGENVGRESEVLQESPRGETPQGRTTESLLKNRERQNYRTAQSQSEAGASHGGRGEVHPTRLASDPLESKASLLLLPQTIHTETSAHHRSCDPPDEERETRRGQHRGGLPSLQLGEVESANDAAVTLGWRPTCDCGAPDGMESDDLEIIESPLGGDERDDDPTLTTGRKGFNRPRAEDEGRRPITRYEQRRYAQQLRASPHRATMGNGGRRSVRPLCAGGYLGGPAHPGGPSGGLD